jgi:RND family efflux transporter MFP subunit
MVKIGSQITGIIKQLYADVGTKLRAGDMIAELDLPDLHAQVAQSQANLQAARERLIEQESGVNLQSTQVSTAITQAQAGLSVALSNQKQVEESANAQIETAQAGIRQAEANNVNSEASLKRTQQLFAQGYVAASDVDTAKAQAGVNAAQLASARENLGIVQAKVSADLRSAKDQVSQARAALASAKAGSAQNAIKGQQVAEARAAVNQALANLDFVKAQEAKAYIRTPISGTVIQLAQQQGETIAAGLSAPTLIIVADLDRLQVDAFVDETDIGKVRLGQPAQVTVDAYPDHPFKGKVVKIASGSTLQQNVVTYDVTIALENPGRLLKPDMTATVNIIVTEHKNVLTVPIDAVKQGEDGNTVTVERRGPDGKPQFIIQKVSIGISDGANTEIISGLKEDDIVILAGQVPGMSAAEQRMPNFSVLSGPRGGGGRGGGGGGRGH